MNIFWISINVLMVMVYLICGIIGLGFTLIMCGNIVSRFRGEIYSPRTIESGHIACEECEIIDYDPHITETEYDLLPPLDRDCAICLTFMNIQDIERLKCKHMFHRDCLSVWMNLSHNCPTCRSKECCVRIPEELSELTSPML